MNDLNILKQGVSVRHKNIKKECEEFWAKNKYYVLSKSHKTYLEIREYLKEKEVDILFLNEKIQKVRDMKVKKIFIMPFFMYGDISKKNQVKLKNKDYLIYWKNIWKGEIIRNL